MRFFLDNCLAIRHARALHETLNAGHVDPHVIRRPQPVQPGRIAMAQHHPRDRQHRRKPMPSLLSRL